MPQNLAMTAVDGQPLAPESVQVLEYLRSRATSLGATGIRAEAPVAPTILVVHQTLPGGCVTPQTFVAELDWREYALVQRLHLLDHRDPVKKLRAALRPAGEPRESDGGSVSS
jgi:hypothetical protein